MKTARLLFLASWLILLVVSALLILGSLASTRMAYFGRDDDLARNVTVEDIRNIGGDEAVKNYRGRRATASTFALGYGALSFLVVLFPYRRAERWAWWALLIAVCASQLLSLGRVLTLRTTLGLGTAGALLAFFLLGLLAGVPRVFFERGERSGLG